MTQGSYILGCEGLRLNAEEKAFYRAADPLGFILFARNVTTPEQVYALTSELRDAVGRDAPVLMDQEGGRVQRMGPPEWRKWLPPLEHVEIAGDNAERAMWLRYRLIADEMRSVGVDVNCAPVADIASDETHPVLRNRCYAQNPGDVALLARSVADGLMAGGVAPIVKHMPGHGRASLDSHTELPRLNADPEELFAWDFAPYKALNDLPMGMSAHIVFEAYDDVPATVSRDVINLIRTEIGFKGLLMTDDISMEALDGTVATRSRASLDAGCDIILHCNGKLNEMDAVANVSGVMPDAVQARADTGLAARDGATDVDIDALEAELADLMGGQVYG